MNTFIQVEARWQRFRTGLAARLDDFLVDRWTPSVDTMKSMIESTYAKLFSSLVTSTIWREDDKTRIVWITMLALKNRHGDVAGSIPGLAALANVSLDDCVKALEKLKCPDPYSRSKEFNGCRITEIEGGWHVLNHDKYRAAMSEEARREYKRLWQAKHRKQAKMEKQSSHVDMKMSISTQADADTDARGKEESPPNFENASPTARLILHEKELGRVTERMKSIKASYSEHQDMSPADRTAFVKLRDRKLELQKLLGVTA